jgi:hypothetical protein
MRWAGRRLWPPPGFSLIWSLSVDLQADYLLNKAEGVMLALHLWDLDHTTAIDLKRIYS